MPDVRLPFTADQFFDVFRAYNEAMWPAPLVLTVLALAVVFLVLRPKAQSGVLVSAALAILWMWVAAAYHSRFFSAINPLAYVFAGVSALGGGVLAWLGVMQRRLRFSPARTGRALLGLALIAYALLAYPAISMATGHTYPAMPTFGLPCPTTLFTVGVLMFLEPPYPRVVVLVPVLWSIVGLQAAFLLGVTQDLALGVAAVAGIWLMVRHRPN